MPSPVVGFHRPKSLAYACSCHIDPPCGYCERWCEDCEGTGEDRTPETALMVVIGGKTVLHMVEPLDCAICDGRGYLDGD